MPVQPTYPGVYIEEIPSGVRTIMGVPTSITAFMGRAERGPINDPVTINSYGDFERRFGGLSLNSTMSYSVRDFFQNGGGQALIVRLYTNPDGDGLAKLEAGNLKLRAESPGDWANQLAVHIVKDTITDEVADRFSRFGLKKEDLFDLEIKLKGEPIRLRSGQQQEGPVVAKEYIRSISVKEGPRRLDRVLEQESALLRVSLKEDGSGPDLPDDPGDTADFVTASGGVDSASLGPRDYGHGLDGAEENKLGIFALEKADLFNILCIPPDARNDNISEDVYDMAASFCYRRRAMLIVDAPAEWSSNKSTAAGVAERGMANGLGPTGPFARNAAAYFPRVIQTDPLKDNKPFTFSPCGIIAGVWARTDVERGVWKAPAGIDAALSSVRELTVDLNDLENGRLNPKGLNCLRSFRVYGRVAWGARTLRGADQMADEYKYIPVRRTALFIEESLYRGSQWAVFEPNDEPLWAQLRLNIGAFMHSLFRQGAFQGTQSKDAYFVKCDKETTTQNDIDRGIVNIVVGFAPLKPAEFVIIKLQQIAGQIQT